MEHTKGPKPVSMEEFMKNLEKNGEQSEQDKPKAMDDLTRSIEEMTGLKDIDTMYQSMLKLAFIQRMRFETLKVTGFSSEEALELVKGMIPPIHEVAKMAEDNNKKSED